MSSARNRPTQPPAPDWDELLASADFRELFRYRKGGKTRTYDLRPSAGRASELWVVSEDGTNVVKSRKLVTFDNPHDAKPFLREVERELREGGWAEV